jgi:uncharacterized membrane protein
MAEEKEYSDLVQEQAEKLQEALKKKKKEEAAFDSAVGQIAGVIFGGPILVILFMAVSLVACTTMGAVMQP